MTETLHSILSQLLIWLNGIANALGRIPFLVFRGLPDGLMQAILAVGTGVFLLVIFKYTSNQFAIRKSRTRLQADMLALRLFKEDITVTLRCQIHILIGVIRLLSHSLVPLVILIIPVVLILTQLNARYHLRPLGINEKTTVTVTLNKESFSDNNVPNMYSLRGAIVTVGPVHVPTKNEVRWQIQACQPGSHKITFQAAGQKYEKSLIVGDTIEPVSPIRPSRNWTGILSNPLESPLPKNSLIQSIQIDYPPRKTSIFGLAPWLIYFFILTILSAFLLKSLFKVQI